MSRELAIPSVLTELIRAGAWPTAETANSQNLSPLVGAETVGRLALGERTLFLNPPPFSKLADEIAIDPEFWAKHGALDEIDPDLALVIGDFGSGSDTVLVLDYRGGPSEPAVMRLAWGAQGNHWVEVTPTFRAFAEALRLA